VILPFLHRVRIEQHDVVGGGFELRGARRSMPAALGASQFGLHFLPVADAAEECLGITVPFAGGALRMAQVPESQSWSQRPASFMAFRRNSCARRISASGPPTSHSPVVRGLQFPKTAPARSKPGSEWNGAFISVPPPS